MIIVFLTVPLKLKGDDDEKDLDTEYVRSSNLRTEAVKGRDDYYEPDFYYIPEENNAEFFELRSSIFLPNDETWCLQEGSRSNRNKLQLTAAFCDGSDRQKWYLDREGFLHNAELPPDMCLTAGRNAFKFDMCGSKMGKWISASDHTLRLAMNALITLGINKKFSQGRFLNRKEVPVGLTKLSNREPGLYEQWHVVHHEQPSAIPTQSPTTGVTTGGTSGGTTKGTTIATKPAPNDNFPTDGPTTGNFSIALLNMGNVTSFDESFEKAKRRWEQLVIGDLPYLASDPDDQFDWFRNTWPDAKTNIAVDDILIGYSFEEMDGEHGVLGFAGPVYVRRQIGDADHSESVTAVSA